MSRVEYGAGPDLPPVSGWAISGIWFAAAVMLLIGTFQILGGIAQIAHDDFFSAGRHYAFAINVTAWGWFDLFFGIIIVAAGLALFAGRPWAADDGAYPRDSQRGQQLPLHRLLPLVVAARDRARHLGRSGP